MNFRNSLQNLISRAFLAANRSSRRLKRRNSGAEQLETRALLAVYTVTSTADTTAAGTLRHAIDQANTQPGDDEIKFDVATNGTEILLAGTQFQITDSLTITGNGANDTIINAQTLSRIFDITDTAVNVTMTGVNLRNGRVSGAGLQQGGAIRSAATGILSISSSVLSTNSVDDTTGSDAYGGAVFVQGGSLTVFGSTITGNTTDWGGAIYANGDSDVSITSSNVDGNFASNDGGAIYAGFGGQGDVTITGSTLENNTSQARGGAIRADNVTITGGSSVRLNNSTTVGGAIAADGNVTVTNSTVSENTSSTEGGAIHASGNVTVTSGSTLSLNTATGKGGAIFSVGSTEVTNSTLSGNSTTGVDGQGGAIFTNPGAVTISQSTVSGNSTAGNNGDGGAIYAYDGEVTISQSTFSGNFTAGFDSSGGAIFTDFGSVTISQSTLSGNSTASSRGGAIFALDSAVTISQSTLSGNFTLGPSSYGGAIYSLRQSVTISQSTLTLNNAAQSAGGAIFTYSSPVTILNSIVAANTDNGSAPDVRKSPDVDDTFTVTNSLIGRNNGTGLTASATPDSNGNLVGGDNAGAAINPQLAPLANNGGPTQTHALLVTSPAINKGSNALAVDAANGSSPLTTDQRGNPFPRIFDTTVDMGAYEFFTGPLVVSTTIDESDGNFSSGDLSLREAILLANSSPETNTITFAPSTNGTEFDLTLLEMFITETLTITGNGATNTVIDAQQLSRIFNFQAGDFTLNGVTLKNGLLTGEFSGGGAIRSSSTGQLTVQNSTLSGNSTSGFGLRGGAISATAGAVAVDQSTLSDNSTFGGYGEGGAIHTGSGALTISRSTLSGNKTDGPDGQGGAIYANSGTVTISQSTLSGNSTLTSSEGGAIYARFGAVFVSQSTLTFNNASQFQGGAIFSYSAPITITNSIVAGNTDDGTGPDVRKSPNGDDAFTVTNSLIGRNNGTGLTATGTTPGLNGNLIGGDTDALKINPQLGPLASNGGPTQTHALLINSPAFNRGSNASASTFTTDQRGSGFARTSFGIVDMGAFESTVFDSPEGTTGADAFVLTYSATTTAGTVTVTVSTAGGPAVNLGTFPMNSPLTINGLGGTDSVRAVGTASADTIRLTSTSLTINAASLILTDIENRTLAGAAGSDLYKFDADAALGLWTLDESGGGTDTLDFSLTAAPVSLNLGTAGSQTVHASNLSLILGSATRFENVTGGSGPDAITGNSLGNTLLGGVGNDKLNGMGGSDILSGGPSNDSYFFGTASVAEADQVNESANQGTDTLSFSVIATDLVLNLGTTAVQTVHNLRTLKLNTVNTFESINGGTGNDTLIGNSLNNRLSGGNGHNILVGLDGADTLLGGTGRDILIGGLGLDKLNGGTSDDILIAGRTTSDTNTANLTKFRTAWTSAATYASRVTSLRSGVGNPVVSLKAKTNVLNDAGEDDLLTGGAGSDWYFRAVDDAITDLFAGETIDVL